MKVLVLVDGEHYPPVTRWGIDAARARGMEPVLALLIGGTEKLDPENEPDLGLAFRRAGASVPVALAEVRSEERRVGKECPVLCRSRWSPYH